jgi:hypothetical protein
MPRGRFRSRRSAPGRPPGPPPPPARRPPGGSERGPPERPGGNARPAAVTRPGRGEGAAHGRREGRLEGAARDGVCRRSAGTRYERARWQVRGAPSSQVPGRPPDQQPASGPPSSLPVRPSQPTHLAGACWRPQAPPARGWPRARRRCSRSAPGRAAPAPRRAEQAWRGTAGGGRRSKGTRGQQGERHVSSYTVERPFVAGPIQNRAGADAAAPAVSRPIPRPPPHLSPGPHPT